MFEQSWIALVFLSCMVLGIGYPADFFTIWYFFNKIYIWPLRDLKLSLILGVGVRTHGAEVTCLGATDLGSEVPGRAQ